MSQFDAILYQCSGGVERFERWQMIHETTYECNAHGLLIVAQRVCSLDTPAATLVHVTIGANEEVVTNITPFTTFNVKRLHQANQQCVLSLSESFLGSCMRY